MSGKIYFRLHSSYLLLAAVIFIAEVLIALFVKDRFIRPYFGDVLGVILIYSFIRGLFRVPILLLAVGVLLFAFFIEYLQYIDFVDRIGLAGNKFAATVIGNSFAWEDIYAYIAGIIIIIAGEFFAGNLKKVNIQA